MRVQCILCILVVLVGLIGSQLSVNQALIAGFAGLALAAGLGAGAGGLLGLLAGGGGGQEAQPQYHIYGGGYGGGHGGGYGGGHGGGGGGHGHGYRRRQGSQNMVQKFFNRGKRSIDVNSSSENQLFEMIAEIDEKDCGKRYICELKVAEQNLFPEEAALLEKIEENDEGDNAKILYKDAAYYGAFVRSEQSCAARFRKCSVKTSVRTMVETKKQQI
ncbi:rRNA 2'-O-methyltransferase fibrillarin [Eurytemora carolleeae]|uniref:rRNA 2'-O-methyltransferase fibrillarin n=1 Tax=Eurytemora carolleeae TaxID=1294199 RepID=UPI000C784D8A|nr:rRNA 2'-O-methyltransferase fibrillarin [Eurytemora carolleeae]|eukprot:XP_023326301.1 rRNA 2'-O-methyltransferase fibrillarin-like [Eurytemora affinis]